MSGIKQMSRKQLADVVADYARVFPGWLPFRGQGFYRDLVPVRQMIWFEPMSTTGLSPYYRPACGLRSLAMPTARMLHFFVTDRFQPTLTQHPSQWTEIVTEMERVFAPDIRKPLDIAEVAALCAPEERDDSANDLVMMAVLHAWLGNVDEARRRCIRVQALPMPERDPMLATHQEGKAFCLGLAKALEANEARPYLENAVRLAAARPELSPA